MAVSKKNAIALAVRYNAFNEASREHNRRGLRSWAYMLRDVQQRTGVELVKDDLLAYYAEDEGFRRLIDQEVSEIAVPVETSDVA